MAAIHYVLGAQDPEPILRRAEEAAVRMGMRILSRRFDPGQKVLAVDPAEHCEALVFSFAQENGHPFAEDVLRCISKLEVSERRTIARILGNEPKIGPRGKMWMCADSCRAFWRASFEKAIELVRIVARDCPLAFTYVSDSV